MPEEQKKLGLLKTFFRRSPRGDWEIHAMQGISGPARLGSRSGKRHGRSDTQAALFFGNLWKLRIIERPDEMWIGIRSSDERPTFPNRRINLPGKTYFLATQR